MKDETVRYLYKLKDRKEIDYNILEARIGNYALELAKEYEEVAEFFVGKRISTEKQMKDLKEKDSKKATENFVAEQPKTDMPSF